MSDASAPVWEHGRLRRPAPSPIWPPRLAALLGAGAILLWPAHAAASTTTIGFDDLAAGTAVSNQYAGQGPTFFSPNPVVAAYGSTSSPPHVASMPACSNGPSDPPNGVTRVTGSLSPAASSVSAVVGSTSTGTLGWTLTLTDGSGTQVAQATASTPGSGVGTPLTATAPSATATLFTLQATGCYPANPGGAFDDLSITTPSSPSSPPPAASGVHAAFTDTAGAAALAAPSPACASASPACATVHFDASPTQFTGGSPSGATYSWYFCDRAGNPCPATPDATGTSATHTFNFAPVHDAKSFPTGVDPARRRSTFLVSLVVTLPSGAKDTVVHPVTIDPGSPPVADFAFKGSGLTTGDLRLFTTSYDPDATRGGGIVEADWYLNVINAHTPAAQGGLDLSRPDIVCTAAGCSGCVALGDCPVAGMAGHPASASFQGNIGNANLAPAPGQFRPARARSPRTRRAGRIARARPARAGPALHPPSASLSVACASQPSYCSDLTAAFPNPTFNFADFELGRLGLVPLSHIDLSGLANPVPPAAAPENPEAGFLNAFGLTLQNLNQVKTLDGQPSGLGANTIVDVLSGKAAALQGVRGSVAGTGTLTRDVTLRVRDAEGELSAPVTHRITLRAHRNPQVALSYVPAKQGQDAQPLGAGAQVKLSADASGVDGPITHLVVRVGSGNGAVTCPHGTAPPAAEQTPGVPTPSNGIDPAVQISQGGAEGGFASGGAFTSGNQSSAFAAHQARAHAAAGKTGALSQAEHLETTSGLAQPASPKAQCTNLYIANPLQTWVVNYPAPSPTHVTYPFSVTFPNPGDYAVTATAFDDLGVASIARLDGFHVFQGTGACLDIAHLALHNGDSLTGDCVAAGGQDQSNANQPSLIYATHPVHLNGLTLTPRSGALVVYNTADSTDIFSTSSGPPKDLTGGQGAYVASIRNGPHPAVDVAVNGDTIGAIESMSPSEGANLAPGQTATLSVPTNAAYRGLPVTNASDTVSFAGGGTLTADFSVNLPAGFGATPDAPPPTETVHLAVADPPSSFPKIQQQTAGVARRHARHPYRARVSDAVCPGSAVNVAAGAAIGELGLNDAFCLKDLGNGKLQGSVGVTLPPPISAPGQRPVQAQATIVIDNGRLSQVEGDFQGPVEIVGGLALQSAHFTVTPSPFEFDSDLNFTYGDLLKGEGKLRIATSPFDARIDGQVGLGADGLSIPLAGAYIDVASDHASFGGSVGFNLGPVSNESTVSGGIAYSSKNFFLEGSGQTCVFVCLDTNAILSSTGVAACGEIKLLVTSVSAGFGLLWNGGPRVFFDSCDLSDYVPADLGNVPHNHTRAGPLASCGPATHFTLPDGLPQAAVRVTADPATAGGLSPNVTLTGPGGKPTLSSPALPGDYGVGPAAGGLVEQNPIDASTTFLIDRPGGGTWTIQPAGPPQVVCVQIAHGLAPVPTSGWRLAVSNPHLATRGVGALLTRKAGAPLLLAGGGRARRGAPMLSNPLGHPVGHFSGEESRARVLAVTVPPGVAGHVLVIDQGPGGPRAVATVSAGAIPPHVATVARRRGSRRRRAHRARPTRARVLVDPVPDGARHQVEAIVMGTNGLPRARIVLGSYADPPAPRVPRPHIARVQRRGSTMTVTLRDRPVQGRGMPALHVVASGAGVRVDTLLQPRQVHRRGRGWAFVLRGVPARASVRVSVVALYDMRPSPAATARSAGHVPRHRRRARRRPRRHG